MKKSFESFKIVQKRKNQNHNYFQFSKISNLFDSKDSHSLNFKNCSKKVTKSSSINFLNFKKCFQNFSNISTSVRARTCAKFCCSNSRRECIRVANKETGIDWIRRGLVQVPPIAFWPCAAAQKLLFVSFKFFLFEFLAIPFGKFRALATFRRSRRGAVKKRS